MASPTQFLSGALINVTQTKDGYAVEQVEIYQPPGFHNPDNGSRIDFDQTFFGIIRVKGYIDISTFEVHVEITLAGFNIGTYDFNLKDGMTIDINLLVVKGSVTFYLKNGNELWCRLDCSVVFDGEYHEDFKIISW